jgi:AcrR family transcriptional regulator
MTATGSDHTAPRRDGRTERTRRALTAAAIRLFSEQGYDATTVDQIAAEAGVTQRTYFHHFPTKEAVLFGGYEARLHDATDAFRAAVRLGSLAEGFHAATSALVAAIETQRELVLLRGRLYRETPTLRATMLRLNEDWIDNVTLVVADELGIDPATDVAARLAATVANSANRVAIDLWTASGGTLDLATLARDAVDAIRPALDAIDHRVVSVP